MTNNNDNRNHLNNDNLNITDNRSIHEKYADAYIKMLNTYETEIKKSMDKKTLLKTSYFYLIEYLMKMMMWLVIISLVFSILIFTIMVWKGYESVAVVTGAIISLITAVSPIVLSIFKLPKIIARYLFNKDEDNSMSEIIQNIQTYELESAKLDDEVKSRMLRENTSSNAASEDTLSSLPESVISDSDPESASLVDTSSNAASEDILSSLPESVILDSDPESAILTDSNGLNNFQ